MSALSDLINRALERRGWSDRSLRELASETHDVVSKDAWAKYRSGRHGEPREATLQAISDLLGLSMTELRSAAGVPLGSDGPYSGPPESARLSSRQRTAIDELIRSIVASERAAAAIALAGVWCALSWWQEAQASYTKALISYLDDDPDPGEQ